MKIIIEKRIPDLWIDKYGLGTWYWSVENEIMRSKGGICHTKKRAERRARKEARDWQNQINQYNKIEIGVA